MYTARPFQSLLIFISLFYIFFSPFFPPIFQSPSANFASANPVPRPVPIGTTNHSPSWESLLKPCFPPRHASRARTASYHLTGSIYSPVRRIAWKEHVILSSSVFLPAGALIDQWEVLSGPALLHVFGDGFLLWRPRELGENVQTPHRKALSPTPPVWAPMTWRSEHATQCPQLSLRVLDPTTSSKYEVRRCCFTHFNPIEM